MNLSAKVDAKVESGTLQGDVMHFLHITLKLNDSDLESPDGGIKAAVKVSAEDFAATEIGQEIMFEETARV